MTHSQFSFPQENVEYAQEKLVQFKSLCEWYDPLIFCEPIFLVGNGLLISPGTASGFDTCMQGLWISLQAICSMTECTVGQPVLQNISSS